MAISTEKQELIEEIGLRLENRLNFAPLAARIYALLTLSSDEGLTFEEIREITGSSKSSISVNLKILVQLKHVDYYTKSGDRRRYFKITTNFQLSALKHDYQSLENDIMLVDKINSYNKKYNPEKFKNEAYIGDITKTYLKEMQGLVADSIKKIQHYEKTGHKA